jgi:predicted TPR repeat methyltransferase
VPPATAADPAVTSFTTSAGLLLVAVKADKTADYEAAIATLQGALAASTDPARRSLAQGWRVFKAGETDAKGNAVYVHALFPTVTGADYRPSLLLDELLAEPPTELLAKYKDALAGPPTRLSLTEFAHMAVSPLKK